MKISAMAALDSKRAIGKNNELLFKIPADFERMKRITSGHPIIMGRKTFESIGRLLPGRTNIIVTHDILLLRANHPDFLFQEIAPSVDEALKRAILSPGSDEIFIFGGGQIFTEALSKIDRLYLTVVNHDFQGDTFFPDYSAFTNVIEKEKRTDWKYPYTFLILEK